MVLWMVTPWDFVNGVVHFIAYKRRSGRHQNLVMGFHMGDEVYHKIGLSKG